MPNWWFVLSSLEALALCALGAYYCGLRTALFEKNERIEDLQSQLLAADLESKHFRQVNLVLAEKVSYRAPAVEVKDDKTEKSKKPRRGANWDAARQQLENLAAENS